MYHKLLLDHARKQYRAAKSIQEDQIYVIDQIHSNRAEQTGYMNSQSIEPEKAEFHTPAIPNTVRDCVQENSLENVSPDPVEMTLATSDTYPQASASFNSKSEDREEIADTSAPVLEIPKEQGTYTPGSQKSKRKNFGKPASSFSDFYM